VAWADTSLPLPLYFLNAHSYRADAMGGMLTIHTSAELPIFA